MPSACRVSLDSGLSAGTSEGEVCYSWLASAWTQKIAVAVVVLSFAISIYVQFWHHAPGLWYSPSHDRNGHYSRCQRIAFALRRANLPGLIKEIHAATVWPPLHPLLTGLVLAIGGIDYRLAVLPSLASWGVTCWFAFALARRLSPQNPSLAGGVALLLTLASPAHRAFAVDVMLESCGAALTVAALYCYVAARQDRSSWHGRSFAMLLLALFLTKYNYWMLLAAGILLSALGEFRSPLRDALGTWRRGRPSPNWLVRQLRHPLTYLTLSAFGLGVYVKFISPLTFTLAGKRVAIGTMNFPLQLGYISLLMRLVPWWWRSGHQSLARFPALARQLVYCFLFPLGTWFLWPRRIAVFLWYVTLGQHGRAGEFSFWTGSFAYYWECLRQDYHANVTSLLCVLGLAAVAYLGQRYWVTGSSAVFVFLAIAALTTNYHPSNRSRFLHSWVATSWVVAGVGAARLLERIASGRMRFLRPALLVGALAGLASIQGPGFVQPGHAEEGGPKASYPSLLILADAVVPELARARQPVVIANVPFELLLDWRLNEHRGPHPRILTPPRTLLAPAAYGELETWLTRLSSDLVLLIDSPPNPGSPYAPEFDITRLCNVLASTGHFALASDRRFSETGNTIVQVWRPGSANSTQDVVSSCSGPVCHNP